MVQEEVLIREYFDRKDFEGLAELIVSERFEEKYARINDESALRVNGIFATTFWNLNRYKECLLYCERLERYYNSKSDENFEFEFIFGFVQLKYLSLLQLGTKLRAHFFLKRYLALLEDNAGWMRGSYEQNKTMWVAKVHRYVAIGFAICFCVFSAANYHFDLLPFPGSMLVSISLMVVALLGYSKNGFVVKLLNRLF